MKKMKVLGIVLLVLCISGAGTCFYLNKMNTNAKEVQTVQSLTQQQSELEKEFKTEGFTFDHPNVILNPYKNAPLTALILFESDEEIEPVITVKGKDVHSTFTHTFKKGTKHMLPIYGLYPDTENEVVLSDGKNTKTIKIQTEKLPDNFILPTEVKADKDKLGNELYFFTPSSVGYTCAYDVNGDVRWYVSNYGLWKIDRLKNGHIILSSERLINNPYYMTGLYEMDLLGKVYTEFSLKGGYHHDYYEMENGNLLVASDEFNNPSGTVEDVVVELDRQTGEIVKTFDLKNILNMKDGKSEGWVDFDWFHNNAVWYDLKTNSITLSGRHKDAVINIDYDSGELNWIIGDSTNWNEEYQKYFFTPVGENFEWQWSQHAAMITPEGYVFILDNGNNKSKIKENYVPAENSYTRGVMYKIDTEKMTIEQIWEYGKDRGSEFYSPYISDVDYLDQNHYIVHSGGIVYVDGKNSNQPAGFSKNAELVSDTVELINDEVVFEIKLPTNNYRVEKMDLYIDDENFEIKESKRIGSLGETEPDDSKSVFRLDAKEIDETYKKHHISITKEIDRLVVSGQFKKDNDVNIVLYQNLKAKYYHVRVSKKPYTALCVYVFTEEENKNGLQVTKYINEDGLDGKYSIYVEIDGTLYNTGEYVEF